jgi:hypothetical protein
MAGKREPKQKTPKGKGIRVPKGSDVFRDLRKAAQPERKSQPPRRHQGR